MYVPYYKKGSNKKIPKIIIYLGTKSSMTKTDP